MTLISIQRFFFIIVKIKVYVELTGYDFLIWFMQKILSGKLFAFLLTHASVRQKEKSKKEHEAAAEFRKVRGALIATWDEQKILPVGKRAEADNRCEKVLIAVEFQHPCAEEGAVQTWLTFTGNMKDRDLSPSCCLSHWPAPSLDCSWVSVN